MALEHQINDVLRIPLGSIDSDPSFDFEAFNRDSLTKLGISEKVFAEQARLALVRNGRGAVFNEIPAHRDEHGKLMKIEIDFMDQIHDPSSFGNSLALRLLKNKSAATL